MAHRRLDRRSDRAGLGVVLKENVNPRSTLMTDSLSFYKKPGMMFARHETVDHSLGEYVRFGTCGGTHYD